MNNSGVEIESVGYIYAITCVVFTITSLFAENFTHRLGLKLVGKEEEEEAQG